MALQACTLVGSASATDERQMYSYFVRTSIGGIRGAVGANDGEMMRCWAKFEQLRERG